MTNNQYFGPKVWDIVPKEFKHKKSLNSFKESIKMWVPTNYPCRLCKVYLDGVGFVNRIYYCYKIFSQQIPLFKVNNNNGSNF